MEFVRGRMEGEIRRRGWGQDMDDFECQAENFGICLLGNEKTKGFGAGKTWVEVAFRTINLSELVIECLKSNPIVLVLLCSLCFLWVHSLFCWIFASIHQKCFSRIVLWIILSSHAEFNQVLTGRLIQMTTAVLWALGFIAAIMRDASPLQGLQITFSKESLVTQCADNATIWNDRYGLLELRLLGACYLLFQCFLQFKLL